jgi:hypothetical protein
MLCQTAWPLKAAAMPPAAAALHNSRVIIQLRHLES